MPYDLALPARPLLAQPLPTHRVLDLALLHHQLGHRDVVPAREATRPHARSGCTRTGPEPGGTEEMVLTDPFDYAAEDALIDSWLAARASVKMPEFPRCPATVWPTAAHSAGPVPRRSSWNERRPSGTMSGIRVLDLSIALTGPYAAALLADQGADVIKVERPGIGDIARWVGVSVNGMSALYLVCNRGKRSIVADLRSRKESRSSARLAAECDVFVQNYRPGVMDKLGTRLRGRAGDQSRASSTFRCRASAAAGPTAIAARTTPSSRRTAGWRRTRPIPMTGCRSSCGRPPPTRSPPCTRARPSPRRCFGRERGPAASTSSCR